MKTGKEDDNEKAVATVGAVKAVVEEREEKSLVSVVDGNDVILKF